MGSSTKISIKKCLIISQGPIPTPEHSRVEGGGLRCWGLAQGLAQNNKNLEVSVAYHSSYKKDNFTKKHEGINIETWNTETIENLISSYDTIIVSYCMGELSVKITDIIRPDQQLVLDCYVPIYVEISARDTNDIDREYADFHNEIGRWAHVLRRGDLFLCASEPQLRYYKGVLSAIGRINPATYGDELILIVPYGIYREEPTAKNKPISDQINDNKYKKLLWFGGIYPWFDLRNLVEAVNILNKKLPAKLIIVGAKNPFNNHPDFTRPYEELVEYIKSNNLEDLVIMQDWVSFDDRADWYLDSDLVVVVNKEGEENELSWRTRLVDFMWANTPIISNGGDPLGEILLHNNAAAKFASLEPKNMANELYSVLVDSKNIVLMQNNLKQLKKDFYWDVVTRRLETLIYEHKISADRERYGNYSSANQAILNNGKVVRVKKIYTKIKKVPSYAKRHGIKNTYYITKTTLAKRIRTERPKSPRVLFFSHQLDMSGAPFVFMDIVREFRKKYPAKEIQFHTFNPAENTNISLLNKFGVKPYIHATRDISPVYARGDVVVLNTVAHSEFFKAQLYESLEKDIVKKLVWYVHEDEPELIFNSSEKKKISKLLDQNKIVIFTAADQTVNNYIEFFSNSTNIRKQSYKYIIPEKFKKIRGENDFETMKFILTGTIGDGRKGQLPIFYAFKEFYDMYYVKNPSAYRNFILTFVGVSNDFLSRQILLHSEKAFGEHFKSYGRVNHEESSRLMMESNVTVCYSMRECLPLFVFEGMAAGHPILRNDSSGMKEQLVEGKNGYFIDSKDYKQVVEVIERVLNKKKTKNTDLAGMSRLSNKIANDQAKNSYKLFLEELN